MTETAPPAPVEGISEALIKWLAWLAPDTCPDPKDSEREVWMKAGERRLYQKVLNFKNKAEKQNPLQGT